MDDNKNKIDNIKQNCLNLIENADGVYFTTIDDEKFPQTRVLFNLRNREQYPNHANIFEDHKEDFMLIFSTNTSSSKIEHIKTNPNVCAYFRKEWEGIMLKGVIEIITDEDFKKIVWEEGWERYYRYGVKDPDFTVLKLLPKYGRYYHQLKIDEFEL
jgi:general stress protein 26